MAVMYRLYLVPIQSGVSRCRYRWFSVLYNWEMCLGDIILVFCLLWFGLLFGSSSEKSK